MSPSVSVLLVVDGLWVGGTERSLVEMLPRLADHGVDARIVCLRERREGVTDEVPAKRVLFLPDGGLRTQVRALRQQLHTLAPTVVHASLFRSNLITRLAAIRLPVRVLNSLVNDSYGHSRLSDPNLSPWRLRLVQVADAVTGRLFVDHFHAVSHSVAAAAGRHLGIPARRLTVIERGRDLERLGQPSPERRARARRALDLAEDAPVVVNVGRRDFQKGQDQLLRAVARITDRHPGLTVLVAGRDGAAGPSLVALVKELSLGGRVRFLGHRDDVPEILAAADLFAFPSRFEGFPGAVLEAMALALPVVAADIPPVREIVGQEESGLLVPPDNDELLAAAMDRLLTDRQTAASLGRRGREIFLQRHTLETSVTRMAALYLRLAEAGTSNIEPSSR